MNVTSKVREFAISYFCVSHKSLIGLGYIVLLSYWAGFVKQISEKNYFFPDKLGFNLIIILALFLLNSMVVPLSVVLTCAAIMVGLSDFIVISCVMND